MVGAAGAPFNGHAQREPGGEGVRLIGVLDLLGGRAVHARAGHRASYMPVQTRAGSFVEPGDAAAIANTYVKTLGITELYVADLDAILGRRAGTPGRSDAGAKGVHGPHDTLVAAIATLGAPLWLDDGISSIELARRALALGAAHVVVGLETLRSYGDLEEICASVGAARVAFSLDLRNGQPIVSSDGIPAGEPAHIVAARAAAAGAGAIIVIDVARVGTGTGPDLDVIARVRETTSGLRLLAGGGVRGFDDLAQLAAIGCDAALVATALHDGRLTAADVRAAGRLGVAPRGSTSTMRAT